MHATSIKPEDPGTDCNNQYATSNRLGPYLVGAALYMTLADVNYTPTPPISEETQEEINEANEAIEEVEEIIEKYSNRRNSRRC